MFKKQKLLLAFIFILGFISGLIVLSLLNANVNSMYLNKLRMDFRTDQHLLAIEATKNRDAANMLVHRQNVVDTFAKESISIFDDTSSDYSFWSPFQLVILKSVTSSMNSLDGERVAEGLERGKLAYTFEVLGVAERAEAEWTLASELAGYGDKQEEFRQLINHLIETELSTLQPTFRASKNVIF